MLHADYLFLLTDVDGLYTTNPRKDPTAKPIDVVSSIQTIRAQGLPDQLISYVVSSLIHVTLHVVSTKTLGSKLGTGGMETKLIAAEVATAAGVTTVISNSAYPERIFDIIHYNSSTRSRSAGSSAPSTPREPLSGRTSPSPLIEQATPRQEDTALPPEDGAPSTSSSSETIPHSGSSISGRSASSSPARRPPHTLFLPSLYPLRDLKSWTSHTLAPAGSVIIDAGAHAVLARRDSGGRLLPAGVRAVEGTFAGGQAVRIVIRRRKEGAPPLSLEVEDVTSAIAKANLMAVEGGAQESPIGTVPGTPMILPAYSITSSINSLELPQRQSSLPDKPTAFGTLWEDESPSPHEKEKESEDDDGWELVEVGRGLANYNSAQIRRVKGLKR